MQSLVEKLKNFYEGLKDALIYILGPIAFCAGIVYYLLTRRLQLKENKEDVEFAKQHTSTVEQEQFADAKAQTSLDAYNAAVAEYERNRKP